MSITVQKINQYKVLIKANLENSLTPKQFAQAMKSDAIKMMEAQSNGDGSDNTVLATYVGWLKNNPLAMEYLTTASTAEAQFQNLISGAVSFTTAACGLPQTYITLHAENKANEPALAGLIALRNLAVDSTYKDDGANLGAGAAGTLLTDANVMALYGTWGAGKYNAIFNNGVLTSIANESNASYDTIAEVAAVYSAWANSVPVSSFFAALDKMVTGGVTGIKFSELYGLANNQTNFNLYTSSAAIKLMASTGGSFSAVTGLSAGEFAALTSTNAIKAIDDAGATYTLLHAVYTADITKFNSLLSTDSVTLASKGLSGVNLSTLSTAYGTTYTVAKDVEYNTIVDAINHPLFEDGVTYAHMAAAYAAGKIHAFNNEIIKVLEEDAAHLDSNVNVLVGTLTDYSGLEAIGLQ